MLGKIFKSNLITGSGVYITANLINASAQFILIPLLTNNLSTYEYGLISMYSIIVSLLIPLIGLNVNGAITRAFYDKKELDFPKYVFTGGILVVIGLITAILLMIPLRSSLSFWLKFPEKWMIIIIIIAFFQIIFGLCLALFQVQQKPLLYGLLQISNTFFNIMVTFILIGMLDFNWTGRIIAILITTFIFALISIVIIVRSKFISIGFKKKYSRDILNYGVPLIPHTIGSSVMAFSDRIFITNMVGLSETGLYTVAYQLGSVIGLVQDSFNKAWVPWFFEKLKGDKEEDRILIVKITYIYGLALFMIFAGYSLFSEKLLLIVSNQEYLSAAKYIIWISLGYFFNGLYKMVTNYNFFHRKTKLIAQITFMAAILNIILNYFLIKMLGGIGAAIATCIVFFISFVLTAYFANKTHPMPWLFFFKNIER